MQGDGRDGVDVAVELAVDVDAVDLEVGLDDGGLGHGEVAAECDAPLDAPLDDEVLFSGDTAADGDPGPDVAGRLMAGLVAGLVT